MAGSHAKQPAALTAQPAVPAIYQWRKFAAAGGLMSYGFNITDTHRLVGIYAGRILKAISPPICRSVKSEMGPRADMRRPELLLRKLTIDPIPLLPFRCSNIEATLGPGERDERAAVHHVDRRHGGERLAS
jgi:hypothetical protein